MKLATKLGIASASVALSFAAVGVNSAQAAFISPYDVSNWTLTNTNADGYVDTSGAPNQITLTGGNKGILSGLGKTDYTTTAVGSGQVSFSWDYSTQDWSSNFDPFQFVLNNTPTTIFNNGLTSGSGTFTTTVAQGDVFGFEVATVDNIYGRGSVTVSNFNAPVPEPSTIGSTLVTVGLVMGGLMKRKLALSHKA